MARKMHVWRVAVRCTCAVDAMSRRAMGARVMSLVGLLRPKAQVTSSSSFQVRCNSSSIDHAVGVIQHPAVKRYLQQVYYSS